MSEDREPIALPGGGALPAVWRTPPRPRAAVGLAHGAGAGMDHPFLRAIHEGLAAGGCLSVRFQFPYMAAGRKAPDRAPVLEDAWRAALAALRARAPRLPVIAAGKSLGGRMATRVAADGEPVDGLILLGYPLHPAGRPERLRNDHFPRIHTPCLFVQGTRDSLCRLDLLRAALADLGAAHTLQIVDGGDHSFRVLKRSGRDQAEVDAQLLRACLGFIASVAERHP